MLAWIAPERSTLFVAFAALLSGLGMGLANNSFLVAVQSGVAAEDRGIATSSVVFMRMIGQSLGTAVFGGLVNARLSGVAAGEGDIVDRMLLPEFRQSLPVTALLPLLHQLSAAIGGVFLIDLLLAAALLGVSFFLPLGLSPIRPARGHR